MELGKQDADVGATYIVRPAFALKKDMWSPTPTIISAGGMIPTVKVDELAATMIKIAIDGSERQIWENKDLVRKGREIFSQAT